MIIAALLVWHAGIATGDDEQVYLPEAAFLEGAFAGGLPEARVLWVEPSVRAELIASFGWRPGLRIRYWQHNGRTAWVLDEIGKDRPITAGFVVEDRVLARADVLVFRESRGWEIRYPFFTGQFANLRLDRNHELDRTIDGITGATLSVNAMRRMARVALRLDEHVQRTELAGAR
jgi:hypothetical protein